MKFTLYAIGKDSGSYVQTFACDLSAKQINDCFDQFEKQADNALGERWYIEYDSLDTEDATEDELEYLEFLVSKW